MTIAQLRYFCTAARYHSITQASKVLFVTQPTVTIAIRELEKEFSLTLFYHSGNRIYLTEEGEAFYQKAAQILSTCDDLKSEYALKATKKSHVSVGIPPLLSTVFFPEMLVSFHRLHPDIWLELQEFGSIRACSLVQDEVLDIGLVNMEMPNIDKFHSLMLTNEELYFCVSPSHPLAKETELDFKRLDKEPVILLSKDSVHNQLLQARFNSLQISPRIIMHSSQITTILGFLERGNCGCFFYGSMLERFPQLIGIPLKPQVNTRIGLIWKRGRYLSEGMNTFLDFCREQYVRH